MGLYAATGAYRLLSLNDVTCTGLEIGRYGGVWSAVATSRFAYIARCLGVRMWVVPANMSCNGVIGRKSERFLLNQQLTNPPQKEGAITL